MDALRILPDNSIHCVATSPPYFGLRDYETHPLIWAGEQPLCSEHRWGEKLPGHHPGQVKQTKYSKAGGAESGGNANSGQFCSNCGAWYGDLGQEPTPYCKNPASKEVWYEMRDDLTEEENIFVVSELLKRKIIR